jgi:hypothetical protein
LASGFLFFLGPPLPFEAPDGFFQLLGPTPLQMVGGFATHRYNPCMHPPMQLVNADSIDAAELLVLTLPFERPLNRTENVFLPSKLRGENGEWGLELDGL